MISYDSENDLRGLTILQVNESIFAVFPIFSQGYHCIIHPKTSFCTIFAAQNFESGKNSEVLLLTVT